jgi:hypothetical protein
MIVSDVELFRAIATSTPKPETPTGRVIVLFDSPGGEVMAGIRIGQIIHQMGLMTAVSRDASCA